MRILRFQQVLADGVVAAGKILLKPTTGCTNSGCLSKVSLGQIGPTC